MTVQLAVCIAALKEKLLLKKGLMNYSTIIILKINGS